MTARHHCCYCCCCFDWCYCCRCCKSNWIVCVVLLFCFVFTTEAQSLAGIQEQRETNFFDSVVSGNFIARMWWWWWWWWRVSSHICTTNILLTWTWAKLRLVPMKKIMTNSIFSHEIFDLIFDFKTFVSHTRTLNWFCCVKRHNSALECQGGYLLIHEHSKVLTGTRERKTKWNFFAADDKNEWLDLVWE